MQVTSTAILLVTFALSGLIAGSGHTQCFEHFFQKSRCVHYAQDPKLRCPEASGLTHTRKGVKQYSLSARKYKRSGEQQLERRYDNPNPAVRTPTVQVAHRCPQTHGKRGDDSWYYGVCLWSGGGGSGKTGWVDPADTRNCGKKVYVQRRGQPGNAVYARIIGSCDLGDTLPEPGCFNLAIGPNLFKALKPTVEERKSGQITELSWDFLVDKNDPSQGAA